MTNLKMSSLQCTLINVYSASILIRTQAFHKKDQTLNETTKISNDHEKPAFSISKMNTACGFLGSYLFIGCLPLSSGSHLQFCGARAKHDLVK